MARTTDAAVAGIIEVDTNITLTPFIETANQMVTDACGEADYTEAKLELIERWLAAHFYAIRDPRATAERAGPVGANFESKVDLGLAITRYGQQAMALDTEGGLRALSEQATGGPGRITAGVTWLGTDDWEDDDGDE
jgi:hypothetical protein